MECLEEKAGNDQNNKKSFQLGTCVNEDEDGEGMEGIDSDGSESSADSYESQERPHPNLNYKSLYVFHQTTPPRNIAIKMVGKIVS